MKVIDVLEKLPECNYLIRLRIAIDGIDVFAQTVSCDYPKPCCAEDTKEVLIYLTESYHELEIKSLEAEALHYEPCLLLGV